MLGRMFASRIFQAEAWSSIVPRVNFCPLLQAEDAVAPLVILSRVVNSFLYEFYGSSCSSSKKVLVVGSLSFSGNFEAKMNLELSSRLQSESYIRAPFCWVYLASRLEELLVSNLLILLPRKSTMWNPWFLVWPCRRIMCHMGLEQQFITWLQLPFFLQSQQCTMSSILVPAWKIAARQLTEKISRSDG